MRARGLRTIAALGALALPLSAHAQAWQVFRFDDAGFAVQLPAAPKQGEGVVKTGAGASLAARTYTLTADGVAYSMTVADFAKAGLAEQATVDDAVNSFSARGQVKTDVSERIDRHFGRELSLAGSDGSRSAISIFAVNGKLYELEGKALGPDPASGTGKTIRFQQSLEFTGLGDEALRPENRQGGGGPGGPGRFGRGGFGGRQGPPPPGAIAACQGKAVGDTVSFTGQGGQTVQAACAQSPDGLVARPNFAGRGGGAGGGAGGGGLGGGQLRAEAIAACQGKAAGDAVSFTGPGGRTIAAACIQTPQGLAARPNRPPLGGPGGPPS